MDKWYDRGITFAFDLFKNDGTILEYEVFFFGKPQNEKFSTSLFCSMKVNVHHKLWIMTIYIFWDELFL